MGGRAGGGAGMGSRSGSASSRIAKAERSIARNDYETLLVFDDKGNITFQKKGTANSVDYTGVDTSNKITTHNHPNGTAFSDSDITSAITSNEKEIRVVGKEYTFSLKRPEGGWNRAPSTVAKKYKQIQNKNDWKYYASRTGNAASDRKLKISLSIDTVSTLSKSFGWDFKATKN